MLPASPSAPPLGLHSPAAGAQGGEGLWQMGAQTEGLQPGRAGEGCGPHLQGERLPPAASNHVRL